jgi:hypothetical protein
MAPCNICGRLISCSCATDVAPQRDSRTPFPPLEIVTTTDAMPVQALAGAVRNSQASSFRTYLEWAAERRNSVPSVNRKTSRHVGLVGLVIKQLFRV